jgi:hypothetical protein
MGRAVSRSAVYLLTSKIQSARSPHDSGRFIFWSPGRQPTDLLISHKCVTPSRTLFRESTGCSAIEGLWGTSDLVDGPIARETPVVRQEGRRARKRGAV